MDRLTGEARDRVRATSLWLVVLLVLVGVGVGLYATLIGFQQVSTASAEVVGVSADGREVTVELSHGGCQQPMGLVVDESDGVVLITAQVSERTPLRNRDCEDIGVLSRETAALEAPIGDRKLRVSDAAS